MIGDAALEIDQGFFFKEGVRFKLLSVLSRGFTYPVRPPTGAGCNQGSLTRVSTLLSGLSASPAVSCISLFHLSDPVSSMWF